MGARHAGGTRCRQRSPAVGAASAGQGRGHCGGCHDIQGYRGALGVQCGGVCEATGVELRQRWGGSGSRGSRFAGRQARCGTSSLHRYVGMSMSMCMWCKPGSKGPVGNDRWVGRPAFNDNSSLLCVWGRSRSLTCSTQSQVLLTFSGSMCAAHMLRNHSSCCDTYLNPGKAPLELADQYALPSILCLPDLCQQEACTRCACSAAVGPVTPASDACQ